MAGLTGALYAAAYAGFLLPTLMAAMTPPFTSAQLFAALVLLALVSTAVVLRNFRKHLPVLNASG